jgi:hypothetical protein
MARPRSTKRSTFKRPGVDNSQRYHFSSEALLQQAVAGLFQRVPDVSDVQILQGPTEDGKDVVFVSTGPLGERMPCACVIKNTRIDGSVAKSSGARTVLFQAQQCLDSPYVDKAGNQIRVERVYVVTPYQITKPAIDSIVGALAHQSRQVNFYDGPKLFALFERWWPDFFADEATAIERYLQKTADELMASTEIPYLDRLYDFQAPDQHVYVHLGVRREFFICSFDPTLVRYLPPADIFRTNLWFRKDDRVIESRYNEVRRLAVYLDEWGFWNGAPISSLSSFLPDAAEIVRQFPEAWHRAAVPISPRAQITRTAPKLATNAQLRFANVDARALSALACRVEDQLKATTQRLQELFERTQRAISLIKDSSPDSELNNYPFAGQTPPAQLDVCLRHAPRGFVQLEEAVALALPQDFLDRFNGSLLVVGPAGSGKTSFCRWNALRDARRRSNDRGLTLPVYIALHRIDVKSIRGVSELLGVATRGAALVDYGDLERGSDRVRLYLDGLDEVSQDGDKQHIMEVIRRTVANGNKYQAIVTARDYIAFPWLDWLPRVQLAELTRKQLIEVARQWLGSEKRIEDFEAQLARVPGLEEVSRNPLLGTLTVLVFRQTGALPDSRGRMYRMFVELLCGGWDLAKGILRKSLFSRDAKSRILTELAVLAHRRRQRAFEPSLLREAARAVFGPLEDSEVEKLESELRSDGIICHEGNQLKFMHLSFQEYFYATDVLGQPQLGELRRTLRAFSRGDDWWRDVLRFYIGMTRDPESFASWVSRNRYRRSAELVAMAEEEARRIGFELKRPRFEQTTAVEQGSSSAGKLLN